MLLQVKAGTSTGDGSKAVAQGLKVICTSLQQSRRLDLQLRGRAGRQGDPGETHMLLDLDDPNMETFALPFKNLFGGTGEHCPASSKQSVLCRLATASEPDCMALGQTSAIEARVKARMQMGRAVNSLNPEPLN